MDWLQLQKDFNAFSNRLRARFLFKTFQSNNNNNSSNNNGNSKNNVTSINQPPCKKSNWRVPKMTSRDLETILSDIETSLFSDTSRKTVYGNL